MAQARPQNAAWYGFSAPKLPNSCALTNQDGALAQQVIGDLKKFTAIQAPHVTDFPAWFSKLRDTFTLSAEVLAALLIALVFSATLPSDPDERSLLRPAALFGLTGVLAALVGAAPSVHANVEAFLLGFVIAGLLATTSAIGLNASDLL